MKSKSLLFIIALPLLAAGCAFQQKSPGATYDRIGQEMQNAVDAKPKGTEDALRQAMMPPAQVELPQAAKIVELRFDLAVNDAVARSVFLALVSGTHYNMLLPPDLSGNEAERPKISINLKNVTVREALESLRELYGYEFKIQKNRIYIQPNILKTHLFRVNYLAGTRGGQSDIRVSSGQAADSAGSSGSSSSGSTSGSSAGSGTVPSSQISTSSSQTGFWIDLENALKSIVGLDATPAAAAPKVAQAGSIPSAAAVSQAKDGRNIIINQASGVIMVKGYPADIRAVEEYLKLTQLIVERQVMIEAKIIQVELNQDFQAGVNWNYLKQNNRFGFGANSGLAQTAESSTALTPNATGLPTLIDNTGKTIIKDSSAGGGLFGLSLVMDNFATLMRFLETQGNVQVLSSPRIATTNNQKAVLKVGTDDYFITEITSSNNNNSNTSSTGTVAPSIPTIKVTPFFSGISLDVTPQIDDESNITLHVHPLISNVVEKTKRVNLGETLGTFQLPFASSTTSETDSVVRVQDGNIVVIGGLMKYDQANNADGLPGTTTSALGLLFGSRANHLRKSELVIMIKPTIIRDESSLKEDLYETQSRLKELDPRQSRQYPAP